MSIYQATLDTRNFSFDGFGFDESGARQSLVQALMAHEREYKLEPRAWFDPEAIEIRCIEIGQGYRDREPISPK